MAEAGSVLFVDDDSDWVELLRTAFNRAGMPNPVQGVKDGPEAIRYLRGESPYANRAAHPLPELVLLDLRLPGMPGFEVLRWIRRQPRLAGLPVVVITGMQAPGDVRRAQELGATGFLIKPFSLAKLVEMARQIRDNWLRPAHGLEERLDLSASERGLQPAKLQAVTGGPKSAITPCKSRASAA
jgi:CheY-like chemotaxis protein